jgi:predicted metal-dependent peptidase
MTPPDSHSRRASRALRRMAEEDPALAALSLWCRHRDSDAAQAAASDADTIRYGTGFEALSLPEQVGLCAHHVLHIALRHAIRAVALRDRLGERFDADVYNIATDALINDTLLLAEYALPRPCVTAVDLLAAQAGETLGPEQALGRYDADRLYLRLLRAPGGSGDGGSMGVRPDDPARRCEALRREAAARGWAPDLDPGGTATAGDSDLTEGDWQQHLARAMDAGRRSGRGIGVFGHRLADLPRPRTPWEVHLRGLLARALTEGPARDPGRPGRRWIAASAEARQAGQREPAFEPGWHRRHPALRLAVALDCSGSVANDLVARFAAEIGGIVRRTGAEVSLLPFDQTVHGIHRLRAGTAQAAIAALLVPRDGGTDFAPVLAAAARLDPALIVVLTDLDGPTGPVPAAPVLWAVPDRTPPAPPFGRVLALCD